MSKESCFFSFLFLLHRYSQGRTNSPFLSVLFLFPNVLFYSYCSNTFNCSEKVTCRKCGTQVTKPKLSLHEKNRSAGNTYCTQCPDISVNSPNDLNYHNAKKHSAPKIDVNSNCKLCSGELPSFHPLQ